MTDLREQLRPLVDHVPPAPTVADLAARVARRRSLRRRRRTVAAVCTALVVTAAALAMTGSRTQSTRTVSTPTTRTTVGPPNTPLSVTFSPSAPVVGDLVTFTVVERGGEVVAGILPDFGDQSPGQDAIAGVGHVCGATTPEAARTRTFTHGYARPGTYRFGATAYTENPCAHTIPPPVGQAVQVVVAATPNPPSNGPEAPNGLVTATRQAGDPPLGVTASMGGGDLDGFVASLRLDWGDGTPPATVNATAPCTIDADGWPTPRYLNDPEIRHVYAKPGNYLLAVTITSTGCDHQFAQQTAATQATPVP